MTFPELIARKRRLERELCQRISGLVEDFRLETGVSPTGIAVVVIEVTEYGGDYKTVVGEVNVEIRL